MTAIVAQVDVHAEFQKLAVDPRRTLKRLASDIGRISARASRGTLGRPRRRRLFGVRTDGTFWRCHSTTVSGLTMTQATLGLQRSQGSRRVASSFPEIEVAFWSHECRSGSLWFEDTVERLSSKWTVCTGNVRESNVHDPVEVPRRRNCRSSGDEVPTGISRAAKALNTRRAND